tara:strand:- start:85 stop:882 length:798 start_codon:yes stop_codon:yes gene_type:complete
MNKNFPIGIFDSGLGGLTVLNNLQACFPNETFIYFGDTARVPYGNKSDEKIIDYSSRIIDYFLNLQVKLIVCACNTSSAIAIKHLRNKYPIPIIDVITPIANAINEHTKNNVVGIIGTRATINSSAYKNKIRKINSKIKVIEKASPLLVPIIENGLQKTEIANIVLKQYLSHFDNTNLDCLILGCTHYPIMLKNFQSILAKNIKTVTSGPYVAKDLRTYLKKTNLDAKKKSGTCKFIVTDFPQNFHKQANDFLNKKIKHIEKVKI